MRWVLAMAAAIFVFVAGAAATMTVLPEPLRPVDYFFCGAVATLLAMLALFVTVFRMSKAHDIFYKTRRTE